MEVDNIDWITDTVRLRLRESSGDAFQEFFATIMEMKHGSDFVRTAATGIGDRGCDGWLKSKRIVYQCYGATNGVPKKPSQLHRKIRHDFDKFKEIFLNRERADEWCFVHNLIDGLPTNVVMELEDIGTNNPNVRIGQYSFQNFKVDIMSLPDADRTSLMRRILYLPYSLGIQIETLDQLMVDIEEQIEQRSSTQTRAEPVPTHKLELSHLPNHWCDLIEGNWKNTMIVEEYFRRHPKFNWGDMIAHKVRTRFQELQSGGLPPGAIMDELFGDMTITDHRSTERSSAARALLTYLFEACEIFGTAQESAGTMILPSKHLRHDRALLGVGAEILKCLGNGRTVSELWERMKRRRSHSESQLTYDWFVFALTFLFIIGAVRFEDGIIMGGSRDDL